MLSLLPPELSRSASASREVRSALSDMKQRHPFLAMALGFFIVANAAFAVSGLLASDVVRDRLPPASASTVVVVTLLAACNVIWGVALWNWRKWGFWGMCLCAVLALDMNLVINVGFYPAAGECLWIALLYGILNIGNENRGWPQLDEDIAEQAASSGATQPPADA